MKMNEGRKGGGGSRATARDPERASGGAILGTGVPGKIPHAGTEMEKASERLDRRMRVLAEQDGVDVLEYVYEEQERGADAVQAVKLASLVAELRRPLTMTDAAAGLRLRGDDPLIDQFARSFPMIFRQALDREGAPRHLAMLKQLARLRMSVEARQMSEAEANVHATRVILEKTMRGPTEEEKQTLVLEQPA